LSLFQPKDENVESEDDDDDDDDDRHSRMLKNVTELPISAFQGIETSKI